MNIDDPIDAEITVLEQDNSLPVQIVLRNAAIVAAVTGANTLHNTMAGLSVAGAAVLNALGDLGQRRFRERVLELFREYKARIDAIGEEKLDREFLASEEFQTLIFEAVDQLRSTHDRLKIKALAAALANSATPEYSADDRKELFIRLVRQMSAEQARLLGEMATPAKNVPNSYLNSGRRGDFPIIRDPSNRTLMTLQQLVSSGLVAERAQKETPSLGGISERSSKSEVEYAVKQLVAELAKPPKRTFSISDLGLAFAAFIGEVERQQQPTK